MRFDLRRLKAHPQGNSTPPVVSSIPSFVFRILGSGINFYISDVPGVCLSSITLVGALCAISGARLPVSQQSGIPEL